MQDLVGHLKSLLKICKTTSLYDVNFKSSHGVWDVQEGVSDVCG